MAERVLHQPDLSHERGFDAVVVGGGPAGVHTAAELDRRLGSGARLLAITQDHPFGGMSQRSLEQFRYAHQTALLTGFVDETVRLYDAIAHESGSPTYVRFPYLFLAGSEAQLCSYSGIVENTRRWGFDSRGELLDAAELRRRYPFIDGPGVVGAVEINNAGRLYADEVRNALIDRASKTTFATGVRAEEIVLDKGGRVTGVRTDRGLVGADRVVLAPGAFVICLPRLFPTLALSGLAAQFTVTRRQLFSAHAPGLPPNLTLFLISPGMAIVRYEVDANGTGIGIYGYADPAEPPVDQPVVDPRPTHDIAFPATVYDLLGEAISGYTGEDEPGPLALQPLGYSAGYYPAFRDELPVVDRIPGASGAILIGGTNHYGVMAAQGLARVAVDLALDGTPPPAEVALNRPPGPKRSLIL